MDDFWQAGLSSICRRALGDRRTVDRPALGEELCAAESFCFDGFGCGELAINVQFGAQPTGMEQATLPGRSSARRTGTEDNCSGVKSFIRMGRECDRKARESCSIWNRVEKTGA